MMIEELSQTTNGDDDDDDVDDDDDAYDYDNEDNEDNEDNDGEGHHVTSESDNNIARVSSTARKQIHTTNLDNYKILYIR